MSVEELVEEQIDWLAAVTASFAHEPDATGSPRQTRNFGCLTLRRDARSLRNRPHRDASPHAPAPSGHWRQPVKIFVGSDIHQLRDGGRRRVDAMAVGVGSVRPLHPSAGARRPAGRAGRTIEFLGRGTNLPPCRNRSSSSITTIRSPTTWFNTSNHRESRPRCTLTIGSRFRRSEPTLHKAFCSRPDPGLRTMLESPSRRLPSSGRRCQFLGCVWGTNLLARVLAATWFGLRGSCTEKLRSSSTTARLCSQT